MASRDERSGRERIQDAALIAFAEEGDTASLRGIARRAGCSPALIQHHFGTKDGLREACDDAVVAYFRDQVAVGIDGLGMADAGFLAEVNHSAPPVIRYLSRALMENSPTAQWFFDALVEMTEPYLGRVATSPTRDRAALLVAMKLGALLLRPYVDRAILPGQSSTVADGRITAAQLDLLDPALASRDVMDAARMASMPADDHDVPGSSSGASAMRQQTIRSTDPFLRTTA